MGKEVTLEQLSQSQRQNATPVNETVNEAAQARNPIPVPTGSIKAARAISASDLARNLEEQHPEAKKQVIEEDTPLVAEAFAAMDRTIEAKKKAIDEAMPIIEANAREMAIENEMKEFGLDADMDDEVVDHDDFEPDEAESESERDAVDAVPVSMDMNDYNTETVSKPQVKVERAAEKVTKEVKNNEEDTDFSSDLDSLLTDLGIDDNEGIVDDTDETTEELRERFRASLASVKPTRNAINLDEYQISREPISISSILNAKVNVTKKRCDWPLFSTGRNMTFEECSGPELDALRKTINNSNGVNGVIASLRFVYNHVIDANKKSFEAWCKSIRTEDIESLYFGMYKACYADANLVARSDIGDKGCKKTSLIDTDINKMVKFADDEAEAKFRALMQQDSTDPERTIKSNIMIVSDDLAISYKDPTLYSTFIQYASIDANITERYADQLNTMAYIDGFFKIDQRSKSLIPFAIKEYKNNINKTVLTKLKAYTELLKTLTNDQYNIMVGKLDNLINESKVSYIYPEAECPECGNKISEEPVESVLNLLFTRAQLVQVKSL